MHAGSGPEYADEYPIARLCDSGLPDPEVCDVLHVPPREAKVVSEAWSRGCVLPTGWLCTCLDWLCAIPTCMHACPPGTHCQGSSCHIAPLGCNLSRFLHACQPILCIPHSCSGVPTCGHLSMRRRWLLGLLVLQSTSSMVLDLYQDLLRNHLVVTLFLTMLVGAGGNAGNQSAIKVIRGLVCTLAAG